MGAEPRLPAVAMMPQRTKLTMMPMRPTTERLPERDAEAQDVGAVTESEDRDVRPEPRPEEFSRLALALGLGDDVDAVFLDAQRAGAAGAEYFRDFAHVTPFATPRIACVDCRRGARDVVAQ